MKALVYTTQAKMDGRKVIEPGKCELLDIPEPQLLPTDDMKIRVDYCAMCATDVHIVTMGLYGMPAPWIMGHELCGTIVEVNPRATENGFAVGDKVVVNCTAPCGCCDECKRGHDIFCKHPIAGSFVHGFTEYCTAVCEQVFQIPKNSPIDPKYYCLAEPMASAMDGMDLADIKIGDNVLLQGCGAIGSIILNMLLLKGGANVTVSDPIAEKRETALKLGAQYVIDPKNEDLKERAMEITNGRGFDVVIEASGSWRACDGIEELVGKGGTLEFFAALYRHDYDYKLNLLNAFFKEIRIVGGVFQSPYAFPRSIALVNTLDLDPILEMDCVFTPEAFEDAFEAQMNGRTIKSLVQFTPDVE